MTARRQRLAARGVNKVYRTSNPLMPSALEALVITRRTVWRPVLYLYHMTSDPGQTRSATDGVTSFFRSGTCMSWLGRSCLGPLGVAMPATEFRDCATTISKRKLILKPAIQPATTHSQPPPAATTTAYIPPTLRRNIVLCVCVLNFCLGYGLLWYHLDR
jgi:hypothetical protein